MEMRGELFHSAFSTRYLFLKLRFSCSLRSANKQAPLTQPTAILFIVTACFDRDLVVKMKLIVFDVILF